MSLPLNLPLQMMQQKWKSEIDPLLSNSLNAISILKNVNLINGSNTINHLLGQEMRGWFLTDVQGIATIYRPSTSPFNSITLTLVSSAVVVVNIGVF